MKDWLKEVINYYKDNPNRYWFKRKLYGFGWTPATREGWLVSLIAAGLIIGNAIKFENGNYPEELVFGKVVIPTLIVVFLLVIICFKTGEPLRGSGSRLDVSFSEQSDRKDPSSGQSR